MTSPPPELDGGAQGIWFPGLDFRGRVSPSHNVLSFNSPQNLSLFFQRCSFRKRRSISDKKQLTAFFYAFVSPGTAARRLIRANRAKKHKTPPISRINKSWRLAALRLTSIMRIRAIRGVSQKSRAFWARFWQHDRLHPELFWIWLRAGGVVLLKFGRRALVRSCSFNIMRAFPGGRCLPAPFFPSTASFPISSAKFS
jgi:hypothetical protein